jgi:hypothetical protein
MFVVKIWVWGWKERGPKYRITLWIFLVTQKKEHVLCLDGVVVNNKIICSNVIKLQLNF